MDGVRLLELFEEYRRAQELAAYGDQLPTQPDVRPVEEIARDVEATVRAISG